MYVFYNGQLLHEKEVMLPLHNRSFQYSDGFFETIILENGQVRFWPEHWERIQEAAAILQIEIPAAVSVEAIPKAIQQLVQKNQCEEWARVKLKIWRSGEGLYTPQTDTADWLLTAQPAPPASPAPLHVSICQSIRTIPSPFSSIKGINAPVYVMASREKAKRQLDDLLLLDPQGHLAELTFSNLFWVKDQTLFTPALATGCLNGIMRRKVIQWVHQNNWRVQEGFFKLEDMLTAELIFAGNVTGLRPISTFEGQPCQQADDVLAKLRVDILG